MRISMDEENTPKWFLGCGTHCSILSKLASLPVLSFGRAGVAGLDTGFGHLALSPIP